jgi:HD-GYP domain-containing protein (c-di-GMP phosphodiesterase class II)
VKFSDLPKGEPGAPAPSSADPASLLAPDLSKPQLRPAAPRTDPSPSEESEEEFDKKVHRASLQATEVYSEAVAAARQIYRALETPLEVSALDIPEGVLQKLINVIRADNQELLTLADRSAPDNYLYGHVVNVTIFSLRLGAAMALSDAEMMSVATGAFLHDLGMVAYLPMVLKPTRLTEQEIKQVQRHSDEGVKLLSKFPALVGERLETISIIVGQVHERMEGLGYPQALGQDAINRLAKIVSVSDMYESLTHMRAWRSRLLPHHVLRVMIEEHERTFEPGLVKSLVEALSLYPPGSFVRLSSGEIGRVVAVNNGLPTRPKVKILVDARSQRVAAPRVVNLAAHPVLYVSDAIDETKLTTSDQRLLLELRAQRWWVRGF